MPVSPGPLVTPDDVLDFLRKRHPKVLAAIKAEAVAAERARIKDAVDGMERESLDPEFVNRDAVLRIIDEGAAPAAEGQSTSSGAASTGYEEKP